MALQNEWVRKHTPADRLYEMDIEEGWGPMCEMLGVPVPDEPFPRANDAEAMMQVSKRMFMRGVQVWCAIFCGVAAVGYGSWWAWTERGGQLVASFR